jgi:EAL domain-containing protein (putative c-di-GMP-specific phosphodiesterase class I)
MQAAGRERELVNRLEQALDLGELQLFYQPKVHAGYHSLIGAEALLRWHTREGESVSPGSFIPAAENHPVIRPLTWWVIKSAIARLARWPEQLSVAVNVPPNLLLDNQILSVVEDALTIHGVTPGRLTLEVTERVMVGDQDTMLEQLRQLWQLGVKISLDDFGTGFSSFAYFRELPVDEIKIDQSFVRPMLESGKDHAIVKSLIELAHNFSLRVVAEGVETLEIAKRLGELGCDVLQGYVFDRPLPVEEFEAGYGIAGEKAFSGKDDPTDKVRLN